MSSIKEWKRACAASQDRVDKQREEEDTLGWRVGAYVLLALVAIDVIFALAFAAHTLLQAF